MKGQARREKYDDVDDKGRALRRWPPAAGEIVGNGKKRKRKIKEEEEEEEEEKKKKEQRPALRIGPPKSHQRVGPKNNADDSRANRERERESHLEMSCIFFLVCVFRLLFFFSLGLPCWATVSTPVVPVRRGGGPCVLLLFCFLLCFFLGGGHRETSLL